MAAVTGAVVAAGATAYAADQQRQGAKDSARAVTNAQQAAQFANNQNFQPYLNAGTDALNQLQRLSAGNFSGFQESPDYQFTLGQGLQGLDRSAAARGNLYSGGQQADVLNYASGLASQQFGNYRNNLMQLAGLGQSAAGAISGVNTGAANQIGNANANAALAGADANSQLVTGLAGLANNWAQGQNSRSSAYQQPVAGGNAAIGNGSLYNFGNNLSNFRYGG